MSSIAVLKAVDGKSKSRGLLSKLLPAWSTYSLKKQLLISFISSVVLSLVLVEVIAIGFLTVVVNNISSTSRDVLLSQISATISDAVTDGTILFEASIRKTLESVLLPINQAAGDAFRRDRPFGPQPSIYDTDAGVDSAGATTPTGDSRFSGQKITLTRSTWLLSNVTGTTPPSLDSSQSTTLDNSVSVDPFFKTTYAYNPNVISSYLGFDNGIFRTYPGTGKVRATGAYDHTNRPWYLDARNVRASNSAAKTSNGSSVSYILTDPYRDFSGKGWMITLSSNILDSSTGAAIGVTGVDMLIKDLKSRMDQISVNGAQTSLYTLSSGVAISNPTWDLDAWEKSSNKDRSFTYKDSVGPSISDDLWSKMTSGSSSTNKDLQSTNYDDPSGTGSYTVVWRTLNFTNGKTSRSSIPSYVLVCIFPQDAVQKPVTAVQNDMNKAFYIYIGISLAIFVVILALVVTLVVLLAESAVRPLNKLANDSLKISNNIGNEDLFNGIGKGDTLVGTEGQGLRRRLNRIDETADLHLRFYYMVQRMRDSAQAPELSSRNAFFQNEAMPSWASTLFSSVAMEDLPDAPPVYDQDHKDFLQVPSKQGHLRTDEITSGEASSSRTSVTLVPEGQVSTIAVVAGSTTSTPEENGVSNRVDSNNSNDYEPTAPPME